MYIKHWNQCMEQTAKSILLNATILRHGRQVILSERGHVNDVWDISPENTRRILTSFYRTGVPSKERNLA